MRVFLVLVLAALAVGGARAEVTGVGICSSVVCDTSALPPDKRFVADLFATRVAERTPPSDAGGVLSVSFALDPSVPGDEALVVVRDGRAKVSAGRFRGLVFGAGWLLKWIDYGPRGFGVRDVTHRFRPAKAFRCAYFARHLFNWYMEAPGDELVRYIEDLALDGINAFLYQFSIAEVDAAHEDAAHIAEFERLSKLMCRRIESLDCDFCEWGGSNQLRQNAPERLRGEPNDAKRGNLGFNACPFKPGALEAMCALRRENLDKLEGCRVGYLCHWSFDEGGCACDRCMPWGGKGMLKTIERLHELNAAAHPEAKTIVSTWYFYEADFAGLWKYLETHDWIDWVLCDDYGLKFPEYPLRHPIPGKTRIATFPDISMWGRFPWGGYGAIALPRFLRDRFRQSAAVADGFMYYSEGNFEKKNRSDASLHPFYDEIVKIYHAERQRQWVVDGGCGGWTCPAYEPAHVRRRVLTPPVGDATALLDALLNDRMRKTYRLGPGTWRTGPVKVRPRNDVNVRLKVILEDGCHLIGDAVSFGDGRSKALFDLTACDCSFEVVRGGKSEVSLPAGIHLILQNAKNPKVP